MALTYDQVSGITEKLFLPKVVDNIFNAIPLAERLRKKEKPQAGGERVIVPLNYAQNSTVGWYSGSDTLSTAMSEEISAAEFVWKQLYANISISKLDELKNSGDAAKVNLVKTKVQIAERSIMDTFATGLYSAGTDAKSIVGARVFCSTSSTYGGISQTSYSWWAAQVDSTTTTLTIGAMQSLFGLCSIGSDTPSVLLGTQANFDRYYALLQPQQRFMDSETAKAGFSSLLFNGKPFIVDSKVPTGYLFMLNESYLDLYPHKDENWKFDAFAKPLNQNVNVAKIFWTGVFACSNCRMQGVMSAITA